MSNLTTTAAQLPDHIRNLFGTASNEDLTAGVSAGYGIISYRGKTWALVKGGERNVIMNEQTGDPRGSLEVVIVKAKAEISKIYYKDGYVEGSTEKPTCYSNNGVAPELDVEERQATKCGVCPQNQWGSKITENSAKGKACADTRRLAVAAINDLDEAMLLRVPAASLRELANYAATLNKRQVPYQAVVTKVGFDPEAAYPKMVFTPMRWLEADEAAQVYELMNSDMVEQITLMNAVTLEAEAAAEKPANPVEAALDNMGPPPTAQAAPAAPKRGRPPKAQVTETQVAQAMAAPAPQPKAEPVTSMFEAQVPQKVAPVPATPAPVSDVLVSASSKLDDLLGELGLDDDD